MQYSTDPVMLKLSKISSYLSSFEADNSITARCTAALETVASATDPTRADRCSTATPLCNSLRNYFSTAPQPCPEDTALSNYGTRLQTFAGSLSWLVPCSVVSVYECVGRGWYLSQPGILRCSCCSSVLSLQLPADTASSGYAAAVSLLRERLQHKHLSSCRWRDCAAAASLSRPPVLVAPSHLYALAGAAHTMATALGTALPHWPIQHITDKLGVDESMIRGVWGGECSELQATAVLMLLAGWKQAAGRHTVRCELCRRSVGLWHFKSYSDHLRLTAAEEEQSSAAENTSEVEQVQEAEELSTTAENTPEIEQVPGAEKLATAPENTSEVEQLPGVEERSTAAKSTPEVEKVPGTEELSTAAKSRPEFEQVPGTEERSTAAKSTPEFEQVPGAEELSTVAKSTPEVEQVPGVEEQSTAAENTPKGEQVRKLEERSSAAENTLDVKQVPGAEEQMTASVSTSKPDNIKSSGESDNIADATTRDIIATNSMGTMSSNTAIANDTETDSTTNGSSKQSATVNNICDNTNTAKRKRDYDQEVEVSNEDENVKKSKTEQDNNTSYINFEDSTKDKENNTNIANTQAKNAAMSESKAVFCPLSQHRHWCGWVCSGDGASTVPGHVEFAHSLASTLQLVQTKQWTASDKYGSTIEGLRSVRELISSWAK